jgi:hypothetical protein
MADQDAPKRLPAHPLVIGLTAAEQVGAQPLTASYVAYKSAGVDSIGREWTRWRAEATKRLADAERALADAQNVEEETREKAIADAEAGLAAAKADIPAEGLVAALSNADFDKFSTGIAQTHYRMVAGYLGGCVSRGEALPDRQLLYLDARLSTWLQISLADVALFNRVRDDTAAFRLRDIIWLRPDARVVRGDDSDSVEQSYLNGPFIRVADLETSLGGGGVTSRSSGLVCEAITPGCCTLRTQRP